MRQVYYRQMYLGKSTNKGVITYTLSANKFDGVHTEVDMHGNTINRAKIGCSVDIAKGSDRAKFKNYIKQCKAIGAVVELELP